MKNKIIAFILTTIFCIVFCSSCRERKPQAVFLTWDGVFSLNEYRGRSPEAEDLVCIVQYAHRPSPRYISDVEGANWTCSGATEYKFGPPSHNIVEVFSDKDAIEQILRGLEHPEHQEHYTVKSEHCLLLISISRILDLQIVTRVPFVLTKNGYAVTPRGKDRVLYKTLTSALEKRDAELKAEKEKQEAEIQRTNAIYHFCKQARESENVDYNKLFSELQKLGATFGAKDPNELKLVIQNQREGMRQMGMQMGPNQPNPTQ